MSQTTQVLSQSRPGTADPVRSRSATAASRGSRRARSRGSTTSIHSNTTQQTQDQHIGEGFSPFLNAQSGPSNHVFAQNPEEMIMRFGQHISHQPSGAALDTSLHDMSRHDNFQSHSMHDQGIGHGSMPPELVPHSLAGMPVPHYASFHDSPLDASLPERMLDENENSEAGARKKRGSSSTVANDNELRKLLRQYEGCSLKHMAMEVQKHEGAGGKSEKVKQVFAMVWLRENCRKSNGSVRRDRVYCCYAERCGSERVSVLNPASFGKLVRIIFPNVQTRRLGVRGESKYHYVDLSVIEDTNPPVSTTNGSDQLSVNVPPVFENRAIDYVTRPRSVSNAQATADTAIFPSPTTSFTPKFSVANPLNSCSCQSSHLSNFDSTITLENVASQTGRTIRQMLHFSSVDQPSVDNESLSLPNIRQYLPANTDVKVADALAALYRTHCISVIDSFRYCKERNLFRHFSAFHGTLTVPVQKLLTHPNLAPWIRECDWFMYQKMIDFVAPLTTQVIPKQVLDAFGSISQRLTAHITETFKAHPVHVSLARLVPAHIFCNLLRHVLDVNQAANAAAAWLCHPDNRNQMWLDFSTLVDPLEMISRSNIPTCAERATQQVLKHDIRALLSPTDDVMASSTLPFFQQPDDDESRKAHKCPVEPSLGDEYNFPDKWIAFILNLPSIFPNHSAQCIVDTVDRLWDAILHRLTLAGAQSFSAWWITKVFFHEMMSWQVERGGFMKYTPMSLQSTLPSGQPTGYISHLVKPSSQPRVVPVRQEQQASVNTQLIDSRTQTEIGSNQENITSSERDEKGATTEKSQNIPTELKAKPTTVPETLSGLRVAHNDDSGIDLGEDSMLMSVGKYGDMMASDNADADGDVVVI